VKLPHYKYSGVESQKRHRTPTGCVYQIINQTTSGAATFALLDSVYHIPIDEHSQKSPGAIQDSPARISIDQR
jgi:hypothetical protein